MSILTHSLALALGAYLASRWRDARATTDHHVRYWQAGYEYGRRVAKEAAVEVAQQYVRATKLGYGRDAEGTLLEDVA